MPKSTQKLLATAIATPRDNFSGGQDIKHPTKIPCRFQLHIAQHITHITHITQKFIAPSPRHSELCSWGDALSFLWSFDFQDTPVVWPFCFLIFLWCSATCFWAGSDVLTATCPCYISWLQLDLSSCSLWSLHKSWIILDHFGSLISGFV